MCNAPVPGSRTWPVKLPTAVMIVVTISFALRFTTWLPALMLTTLLKFALKLPPLKLITAPDRFNALPLAAGAM